MTTIEVLLVTFQILVGVVLTPIVPYAFMLERRLARIEAAINETLRGELHGLRQSDKETRTTIRRHSDVVREHDKRIMVLENQPDNLASD